MYRTLLDKAKSNLALIKLLSIDTPDAFIEIHAYYVQQIIEKSLKHLLELKGIRYLQTSDITVLLDLSQCKPMQDKLKNTACEITKLEYSPRYDKDFFIEEDTLARYTKLAEEVLAYVESYEKKVLRINEFP